VLAKMGAGLVVRASSADARGTTAALGFSMLSCGAVAMGVGLGFSLRFPGRVGDAVLLAAAVSTVFGEFVGPAALRGVLRKAGEIAPASESTFLRRRAAPAAAPQAPEEQSPVPGMDPAGGTPVPGAEPAGGTALPRTTPIPERRATEAGDR
jgi:hypothetical protein